MSRHGDITNKKARKELARLEASKSKTTRRLACALNLVDKLDAASNHTMQIQEQARAFTLAHLDGGKRQIERQQKRAEDEMAKRVVRANCEGSSSVSPSPKRPCAAVAEGRLAADAKPSDLSSSCSGGEVGSG